MAQVFWPTLSFLWPCNFRIKIPNSIKNKNSTCSFQLAKSLIIRLALLILLLSFSGANAQNWQRLADFPAAAVDDGVAFRIGDTAYFGTGLSPWFSDQYQFHAFDLANETWLSMPDLPPSAGRQYSAAFANANVGFVFGGIQSNQVLNDLWVYNPQRSQWNSLSPLPAHGRSGSAAFRLGDTAYIIGGRDSLNSALSEVWAYSISGDSWQQKNDLPIPLWRASATVLNDTAWLIFGRDSANSFRDELYFYEPSNDQWILKNKFPGLGRSHANLLADQDHLYLSFGQDSTGQVYNDLWQFSPAENLWTPISTLNANPRKGCMANAYQSKLYFCTGIDQNSSRLKEFWKFNLAISVAEIEGNAEKELLGIYDLWGREVHQPKGEFVIFLYSDGSSEKYWIAR